MQQELRPDFSLPGEKKIFNDMIKLTINMMEESQEGCPLRVQHAKAAACLAASFEIASDIPADLRHGVFSQPGRVFETLVRFSTAQGKIEPDSTLSGRSEKKSWPIRSISPTGAVPPIGWAMQSTPVVRL